MDFLTGAFFVVGLRRSQGLVGTGGVESGGRKSHDRAGVHSGRARPVQRQTGDLSRKAPWSGCTRARFSAARWRLLGCVGAGMSGPSPPAAVRLLHALISEQ